jgi:hypothetical protein
MEKMGCLREHTLSSYVSRTYACHCFDVIITGGESVEGRGGVRERMPYSPYHLCWCKGQCSRRKPTKKKMRSEKHENRRTCAREEGQLVMHVLSMAHRVIVADSGWIGIDHLDGICRAETYHAGRRAGRSWEEGRERE